MLHEIVEFIAALNTISPIAIIGLLVTTLYLMVRGKNTLQNTVGQVQTDIQQNMNKLETNDLHELPEIAETLRRIEVKLSEEFSYIRGRLNGNS